MTKWSERKGEERIKQYSPKPDTINKHYFQMPVDILRLLFYDKRIARVAYRKPTIHTAV